MKIKLEQLLLSIVFGLLTTSVVAYTPVDPAFAGQEKKTLEVADSGNVTYKRVRQFPEGPFDAHVVFANLTSTQDLKAQFASRGGSKELKNSISHGFLNLVAIASLWVKEFKASSALTLTKTVFVQLKNDRDSVLATVILRKSGTGTKPTVTADILIEGLLYAEPVYLGNLLYAAFVKDAFTLKPIHALYAAGILGAGYLVTAKIKGWKPFTQVPTNLMQGLVAGLRKQLSQNPLQQSMPQPFEVHSFGSRRSVSVSFEVTDKKTVVKTFTRTSDTFDQSDYVLLSDLDGGFIGTVTNKAVLQNSYFLDEFLLPSKQSTESRKTFLHSDAKFILIVPASVWYENEHSSTPVIHPEVAARLTLMGKQAQVIVFEDRKAHQKVERTNEQLCDDAVTADIPQFTYINFDQKNSKNFLVKFVTVTRYDEKARRPQSVLITPLSINAKMPFAAEQMKKVVGREGIQLDSFSADSADPKYRFQGQADLVAHAWVSILESSKRQLEYISGSITAYKPGMSPEDCCQRLANRSLLLLSAIDIKTAPLSRVYNQGLREQLVVIGLPLSSEAFLQNGSLDLVIAQINQALAKKNQEACDLASLVSRLAANSWINASAKQVVAARRLESQGGFTPQFGGVSLHGMVSGRDLVEDIVLHQDKFTPLARAFDSNRNPKIVFCDLSWSAEDIAGRARSSSSSLDTVFIICSTKPALLAQKCQGLRKWIGVCLYRNGGLQVSRSNGECGDYIRNSPGDVLWCIRTALASEFLITLDPSVKIA